MWHYPELGCARSVATRLGPKAILTILCTFSRSPLFPASPSRGFYTISRFLDLPHSQHMSSLSTHNPISTLWERKQAGNSILLFSDSAPYTIFRVFAHTFFFPSDHKRPSFLMKAFSPSVFPGLIAQGSGSITNHLLCRLYFWLLLFYWFRSLINMWVSSMAQQALLSLWSPQLLQDISSQASYLKGQSTLSVFPSSTPKLSNWRERDCPCPQSLYFISMDSDFLTVKPSRHSWTLFSSTSINSLLLGFWLSPFGLL